MARSLAAAGVEIISTGGTAKALREAGLNVTDLSAYTGFPEMLDGRVKTLHPKVHGGLLYLRGNEKHEAAVRAHGIEPIDLVVVNLYPFEQTVARPNVSLQEAIENIDIGGPSMLRSAAKNHESVTVVVDPDDYEVVGEQIKLTGGTTLALRRKLAIKVFACLRCRHLRVSRRGLWNGATRGFTRVLASPGTAGPIIALWRKPAPESRSLRQFSQLFQATARQGAVIQ